MIWLVVLWIACAPVTFGMFVAEFTAQDMRFTLYRPSEVRRKYRENLGTATFFTLFGPISLLIVFLDSGFAQHGLRFRAPSDAEIIAMRKDDGDDW